MQGEVRLAASIIAPRALVAESLAALAQAFPSVAVHVSVEEIGGATERVAAAAATLGIVGKQSLGAEVDAGLEAIPLGAAPLAGVAAPGHPLAEVEGPLDAAQLADHRQIAPQRSSRFAW